MNGQEEAVAPCVLEAQELVGHRAELEHHQSAVDSDAVILVDEVITRRELSQGLDGHSLAPLRRPAALLPATEDLLLGDHGQALEGKGETFGESRATRTSTRPRLRPFPARLRRPRQTGFEAVLAQQGSQPLHNRRGRGRRASPANPPDTTPHSWSINGTRASPLVRAHCEGGSPSPRVRGSRSRRSRSARAPPLIEICSRLTGCRSAMARWSASAEIKRSSGEQTIRSAERAALWFSLPSSHEAAQPIPALRRLVEDDQGVPGKEVEDRLQGGLKQRRQGFGAGREVAAQQGVDQCVHDAGGNLLGLGEGRGSDRRAPPPARGRREAPGGAAPPHGSASPASAGWPGRSRGSTPPRHRSARRGQGVTAGEGRGSTMAPPAPPAHRAPRPGAVARSRLGPASRPARPGPAPAPPPGGRCACARSPGREPGAPGPPKAPRPRRRARRRPSGRARPYAVAITNAWGENRS